MSFVAKRITQAKIYHFDSSRDLLFRKEGLTNSETKNTSPELQINTSDIASGGL
jgi:hypothetical protein